jgi:hypothetical protein
MKPELDRIARNEALYRAINENIEQLTKDVGEGSNQYVDFLCECGRDEGCPAELAMTVAEYESVRSQDDRFALKPGHETPELERVVEANARFVVVDKIPAADEFVSDDPRGAPSS